MIPLLLASAAQAEGTWGDQLAKMVTDGKASVDFRYRYEGVDDDGLDPNLNPLDDAKASTLRSRLTLESAAWNGVSVKLEADDVTSVVESDYNSTENGKTGYATVADPEGTDLNQAWIKYQGDKFDGTLGRQRINHGNQRFVGGVGWRQNEQTYDGLRFNVEPIDKLKVDVSYIYNINRIFGPDDGANPADLEGDNWFLRTDYQLAENHKLAAFGYFLDIDDQGGFASGKTVNNSSDTFGVEYSGKFEWLSVFASWATQSEAGDSDLNYDADYYVVELAADLDVVTVKAGYEVLGGDDEAGFSTPLATLHKFQGWADKFLNTPAAGIEDAYLGVSGKAGPVKLAAVYHDFAAEDAGFDYGTELDLVATWPVNKQFSVQGKYATFDADDVGTDVDKFWVTLQLKL
jgi:hypothetical protein